MSYQRVTLAEFRLNLQETWEGVPFWDDTDALIAINDTLRWWNLFTGMWRRTEIVTLTADEHFYTLSSTLVLPTAVRYQGYPLDGSSLADLDCGRPGWQAENIMAPGVPARPAAWAPHGLKGIVVWPAIAFGTAQVEVDGVRNTPVLVADADFVDLGEDEFSILLNEALFLASFKEGGPRFQQCQQFHQTFLKAVVDKSARLKASALFRKWAGIDPQRGMRPFRVADQQTQDAQSQGQSQGQPQGQG
jgi:hypothetical protein